MIFLEWKMLHEILDCFMHKITISETIKKRISELVLGCIECNVKVSESNPGLWEEIENICKFIKQTMDFAEVSNHPAIKASRLAYRLCGKDPARYRLSSEALMRRVIKGYDLYRINNVVDVLNLVSLRTGMSIGGYDAEKIEGDIVHDLGLKDEPYEGIGRGELNIESLPVFRDRISAFGSPTSDSVRTSVTNQTKRYLMIIFGFSGIEPTNEATELSVNLLKKHAEATDIETFLIQ
jgi:DNA/RNA-binding domain of Phe-tRNA-synthetase-like protein